MSSQTFVTATASTRTRFGVACMLSVFGAGLFAQSAHSETLLSHATRATISVSAEVVESCTVFGSPSTIAAHASCIDGSPYSVATSAASADPAPAAPGAATVSKAGGQFVVVTF